MLCLVVGNGYSISPFHLVNSNAWVWFMEWLLCGTAIPPLFPKVLE